MMDTENKPNKTAETEALSDEKLDKVAGGINPDVNMRFRYIVTCDRACGFSRGYFKSGDALDFAKAHKRCPRCTKGKLVIK